MKKAYQQCDFDFVAPYYAASVHQFNSLPPSTNRSPSPILSQNPLLRIICDKIRTSGPITVAEYMQLCVNSPLGYYARQKKIFGEGGDFVTSPELTQIFGELIGSWIVHELEMTSWQGRWQLVELGPGSGELIIDVLTVLRKFDVLGSVEVYLVESSERLMERQRQTLNSRFGGDLVRVRWYDSLDDVPQGFSVFVANEFLDALPLHLFVRDEANPKKWCEQYVTLDRTDEQRLCFMLSAGENIHTKAWIPQRIREDESRTKWEFCPQAHYIVRQMVQRFTTDGGFALLIDYGHDGSRRDFSLRAKHGMNKKRKKTLLRNKFPIDITADVDFGELSMALRDECLVFGPVEQRAFLGSIGFHHRLNYLLNKSKTKEERVCLLEACRMLIADDQMGSRPVAVRPMDLLRQAEIVKTSVILPNAYVFN
uniref:Protein arginine methyltransferase NDUFAF7 n=1 Tax=Globodera rostochiensis TaxID=31243 RepID=A0A914HY29_GLORO